MKKTFITLLLGLVSLMAYSQTVVYTNDFESAPPFAGFDVSITGTNPLTGQYLGRWVNGYGNQQTTLTVTNLPPHQYITVEFDLLIFNTWDGNGHGPIDLNNPPSYSPDNGPDIWKLVADDNTLIHTTFSSHDLEFYRYQSYPGTYPQDAYRAGEGAVCVNCLGEQWDLDWYTNKVTDARLVKDALYHITVTYTNTVDTTVINFQAFNISGSYNTTLKIIDEFWGIDNVSVTVSDQPLTPLTVCEPQAFVKIIPNAKNTAATVYVWGEADTTLSVQSSVSLDSGWVCVNTNNFNGYSSMNTSLLATPPVVGPQTVNSQPPRSHKFLRAMLLPKKKQ